MPSANRACKGKCRRSPQGGSTPSQTWHSCDGRRCPRMRGDSCQRALCVSTASTERSKQSTYRPLRRASGTVNGNFAVNVVGTEPGSDRVSEIGFDRSQPLLSHVKKSEFPEPVKCSTLSSKICHWNAPARMSSSAVAHSTDERALDVSWRTLAHRYALLLSITQPMRINGTI